MVRNNASQKIAEQYHYRQNLKKTTKKRQCRILNPEVFSKPKVQKRHFRHPRAERINNWQTCKTRNVTRKSFRQKEKIKDRSLNLPKRMVSIRSGIRVAKH